MQRAHEPARTFAVIFLGRNYKGELTPYCHSEWRTLERAKEKLREVLALGKCAYVQEWCGRGVSPMPRERANGDGSVGVVQER